MSGIVEWMNLCMCLTAQTTTWEKGQTYLANLQAYHDPI